MGIFSRKPSAEQAEKAPITKTGRIFGGIQDELERNRRNRTDEVAAKRNQNRGKK